MLLSNASSAISLNDIKTCNFSIRHGMRQGCTLAPYLVLLVAEAFQIAARYEMKIERLRGINLPDNSFNQLLT